jgi:hypothetical protein
VSIAWSADRERLQESAIVLALESLDDVASVYKLDSTPSAPPTARNALEYEFIVELRPWSQRGVTRAHSSLFGLLRLRDQDVGALSVLDFHEHAHWSGVL